MSHPKPTTTEVNSILDTSLDDTSLQAHIDAANHEVDDIQSSDSSISDSRLTDIHLYLSAYYATAQEQRPSSQSGESRSISYSDEASATYYEMAKRLDPTGKLGSSSLPGAGLTVHDAKGIND